MPLGCYLRNPEKVECSMAEAMAATLGVSGYRKWVESWLTAGKHWVAAFPIHCLEIYRVCSRVVGVKARVRVDAEVKMLWRRCQLDAWSEEQ